MTELLVPRETADYVEISPFETDFAIKADKVTFFSLKKFLMMAGIDEAEFKITLFSDDAKFHSTRNINWNKITKFQYVHQSQDISELHRILQTHTVLVKQLR